MPAEYARSDAIRAAHELGKVVNAEVSVQRHQAVEIMRIMGRGFYDKIKQWGPTLLETCRASISQED